MSEYMYKATRLIAEGMDAHNVKYNVVSNGDLEQVLVGFPVDMGPNVMLRFISRDNDNDVACRIMGLICRTTKERHDSVLKACNELNRKIRYMKFNLDSDGDINVEFDFPVKVSDSAVGEMAFEIFIRVMKILDAEFPSIVKATYIDEVAAPAAASQSDPETDSLLQRLRDLRRRAEGNATGPANGNN